MQGRSCAIIHTSFPSILGKRLPRSFLPHTFRQQHWLWKSSSFSSKSPPTSSSSPAPPVKSYSQLMNNPYAMLQSTEADPNVLIHSVDRYSGITVPDTTLSRIERVEHFESLLATSLEKWVEQKRRGLWLQIPIDKSDFIRPAAAQGFEFHHAQPKYVMMTLWLPHREFTRAKMAKEQAPADGLAAQETASSATTLVPPPEPSMIPDYASHSLGIGCLVLNSRGECLVIQEKFSHPLLPDFWKLPGGAIDTGEDIPSAAEREVKEETNVDAKFQSLVGFRHLLNFRFGTGDLYFIGICTLKDEANFEPTAQPEEISKCKWWDVQEFLHFHSTRWFQDLIREPVLQEWRKLFPGKQLPPPPSPERMKELQTMPPHPQAAEGKHWPDFPTPIPPPPGSSVGMSFSKIQSPLGKIVSNFYVTAPPTFNLNNSSSSSSSGSPNTSGSSKL